MANWGPPERPLQKPLDNDAGLAAADVAAKYTLLSSQATFNKPGQRPDYPPSLLAFVPQAVWETSIGGGNPFALGEPMLGETVADLGCGAGMDVCLAAALVGNSGRVLGIDSNEALLERAAENLRLSAPLAPNPVAEVTFIEGHFDKPGHPILTEHYGRCDLVISNGALCLSFDKPKALAIAFSLLRPGGRFQLFDLCQVDETVPEGLERHIQQSWFSEEVPEVATVESWANWVSGCELPAQMLSLLTAAGFEGAEMHGWTPFMTSPKTRGARFVAKRPDDDLKAANEHAK